MLKLGVGAIFKNEAHIIEEWIEHYLKEGVDRFYLIDNGSTDNYRGKIEKYCNFITLYKDPKKYAQDELYNTYFSKHYSEIDWLIILDLDEFMYSRLGYRTIKDYLITLPENISQIHVIWKNFSTNFFIFQPPKVVPFFTYYSPKQDMEVKSILRTKEIRKIGIHKSYMRKGITVYPCPNFEKKTNYKEIRYKPEKLSYHYLHLNHYRTQSWEFFNKVKMTRGDAATVIFNNLRNEKYFREYDRNTILDEELKKKHYGNNLDKFNNL